MPTSEVGGGQSEPSGPMQISENLKLAQLLLSRNANPLAGSTGSVTRPMTAIEPGRLLQLRSAILNQNQALQRAVGHDGAVAEGGTFGRTLIDAVRAVSEQQAKASAISESYERGDTTDIVQVMVERQKASLGFEATLQVRNKLLSAYRDIMNMPV